MSKVAEIISAIAVLSPEDRQKVLEALEEMESESTKVPEAFWNKLEELEQGR